MEALSDHAYYSYLNTLEDGRHIGLVLLWNETRDHPRIEFSAPLRRIGRARGPAAANVEALLELGTAIEQSSFAAHWEDVALVRVERHRLAIADYHRGALAQVHEDDPAAALAAFDSAFENTPAWGWIAYNVESVLRQSAQAGRAEEARHAAEILRRRPAFAHLGHYHLATLLAREGDLEGAARSVAQALALEPGHGPSLRLRAELKR